MLSRIWRGGHSTAADADASANANVNGNVQVATVDLEDFRAPHPAIILSTEDLLYRIRIVLYVLLGMLFLAALGGCAVYDHRDGGGYTVRYASVYGFEDHPKYVAHPPPRRTTVVVVKGGDDSHPVLNIGKDDEIPREYRHYVSDRSLRTIRSRNKMCAEARPGYCAAPNVPHCHGPFCHAHSGGDKRHTH